MPHIDAVEVKACSGGGYLEIFVIRAVRIVQTDVIPQCIYCPYATGSMNVALVETCTQILIKTFCKTFGGNPAHEGMPKAYANSVGWPPGRRSVCLFLSVCQCGFCFVFKKGNYCVYFSDGDTYFPKSGDQELVPAAALLSRLL